MSRFSREPDHATLPLVPMMEAADGRNFHGGSVSDPLDGPRVRRVSEGAYGQLGQTPGAHRVSTKATRVSKRLRAREPPPSVPPHRPMDA
jgi:hypothetical protein